MRYLLDVNILVAAIWDSHTHHKIVFDWLNGKEIALCPLSELGFLRVSTQPKGYNFSMEDARQGLVRFRKDRNTVRISDDLDPLASKPKTASQITDHYLADMASKHGFKFATLDVNIKHPAVELIVNIK